MDDEQARNEALIEASAMVLGLTIKPHQREGVRLHLGVARQLAALLEAVPLPAEAENGPVFRP